MDCNTVVHLIASLCVLLICIVETSHAIKEKEKKSTELNNTNIFPVLYHGESQRLLARDVSRSLVASESKIRDVIVHVDTKVHFDENKESYPQIPPRVPVFDNQPTNIDHFHGYVDQPPTSLKSLSNGSDIQEADDRSAIRVNTAISINKANDLDTAAQPLYPLDNPEQPRNIFGADRNHHFIPQSPYQPEQPTGILNSGRSQHFIPQSPYQPQQPTGILNSDRSHHFIPQSPYQPQQPTGIFNSDRSHHFIPQSPYQPEQPTGILNSDRSHHFPPQSPYQPQQASRPGNDGNFVPFASQQPPLGYRPKEHFMPFPYHSNHNRGGNVDQFIQPSVPEYNGDGIWRSQPQPDPALGVAYPTRNGFHGRSPYPLSQGSFPGIQRPPASYRPLIGHGNRQLYPGASTNSNPWICNIPNITPDQYYPGQTNTPPQYNTNLNPINPDGPFQYPINENGRALYRPMPYPDDSRPRTPSRSPVYPANIDLSRSFQSESKLAPVATRHIGGKTDRLNGYNLQSLPYFEPSYVNRHQGESPPPQLVWYPRDYKYNPVEFRDIPNIKDVSPALIEKYVKRSPTVL